jgi:hypothetical protein
MTRLEKCELLKSKGYTYNPETGKIYGVKGKEITNTRKDGYVLLNSRKMSSSLYAHHYAWYMTYDNVDFNELDHIDRNPSNNRIDNLRIVTSQQNKFNKDPKGYSWDKTRNKWVSHIHLNKKQIYLGRFNTEEEARNAYLQAKEKYHII